MRKDIKIGDKVWVSCMARGEPFVPWAKREWVEMIVKSEAYRHPKMLERRWIVCREGREGELYRFTSELLSKEQAIARRLQGVYS